MLFLVCAILGLPALAHAGRDLDDSLRVRASSGTFTGFVSETAPDVNQWLGVPYGQPPVGDKRFMPPEPAEYGGDLDATEYKPICFQQSGNRTGIFWELVPEFQNQDPQSEDCRKLPTAKKSSFIAYRPLVSPITSAAAGIPSEDTLLTALVFLNIWAPRKPVEQKVPVLIWVCGGGLQEGGGHAPYQVPDQWIQLTQTHLVLAFKWVTKTREWKGHVLNIRQLPPQRIWLPRGRVVQECRYAGHKTCVSFRILP